MTSAVSTLRPPLLAARGRLSALSADTRLRLLTRAASSTGEEIRERTREIIARVRRDGDRALMELARELDHVSLDSLEVSAEQCKTALQSLEPPLRKALERAMRNLQRAQSGMPGDGEEVETEPGVVIGRRADALERVGIYAPGGRAAYPSSVLMAAVPARLAGVRELVLCSPPAADGLPARTVLAAAALAGVDRVFAIGGAGAIAAMAVGTALVPRVDRVVGPGNAYVAQAKLELAGEVAFDCPAGPSELLVIWDSGSDPDFVAREMLAQAEHDPLAAVLAIGLPATDVSAVERSLAACLESAPRRDIARVALASRGAILSASEGEAREFASAFAPEHLLLAVSDPEALFREIRNAGTVYMGYSASVAFGDYITGANHVLPTGGMARSYSGLSAGDFVRWTTYQRISRDAAARLARHTALIAESEGLPGHAAAARAWGPR